MWFSFVGRIQTRLISLLGPLLLTFILSVYTEDRDYWFLFVLMIVVGLALDVGVYGWIFGYQPRWLTILLGVAEFLVLKWIVEWPYPFEIRLHTKQALLFYVAAWMLSWITVQALLPGVWPRWAEDGGELRFRSLYSPPKPLRLGALSQRRLSYASALFMLVFIALPWMGAYARTPEGMRFTGFLWLSEFHRQALIGITSITHAQTDIFSGLIIKIAQLGRWTLVGTYYTIWILLGFMWLIGIQTLFSGLRGDLSSLMGLSVLPVLLFNAPYLLGATIILWIFLLLSTWRVKAAKYSLSQLRGLSFVGLVLWGMMWILPSSVTFISHENWQALLWIQQSLPQSTTIQAPEELDALIPVFTGHLSVADDIQPADYRIVKGDACLNEVPAFTHGHTCILLSHSAN